MKPLHYAALAPLRVAQALQGQAYETFRPLLDYVRQAIFAAKERQVRHELPWVASDVSGPAIVLEPLDTVLEVVLPEPRWRVTNWPAERPFDREQPLMVVTRGLPVRLRGAEVLNGEILLTPEQGLEPEDHVFWCAHECVLEPIPVTPPQKLRGADEQPICIRRTERRDDRSFRLTVEGRHDAAVIRTSNGGVLVEAGQEFDGLTALTDPSGNAVEADGQPRPRWSVRALPEEGVLQGDNGVRFAWSPVEQDPSGKRGRWVQLRLPESEDHATEALDPRAAFCEDDVEEVWTQARRDKDTTYKVRRVDRDRYRLLLDRLPPPDTRLFLPVNLRNLYRQRDALDQLQNAPLPHHRGLLRLAEAPERVRWPSVPPAPPDEWFVLTDENRSGTVEQRAFVAKALAGPDLALCEGPPGSGKTTAICELILQLVARQQRVLLCASTHVAVDNVLEMLSAHPRGGGVVSVRLGKLERVDASVQEHQIDARVERLTQAWRAARTFPACDGKELHEMAERAVVATADLTCGTTLGILSHPALRTESAGESHEPLARSAHFDVLILDEASKTTVPEFLVPALLAQRCVIVGDVQQLAPFADRSEVADNLRNLADPKTDKRLFTEEHQRARLLVWRLSRHPAYREECRWLAVEAPGVLDRIEDELAAVRSDDAPMVVRVVRDGAEARSGRVARVKLSALREGRPEALFLAAASWVLVEERLLAQAEEFLPGDLLSVSRTKADELDAWGFRHEHALPRESARARFRRPPRERGRDIPDRRTAEHNEREWLARHDWGREVAWRLIRCHELTRSPAREERERYAEEVAALLPRTVDIEAPVHDVAGIGLPSVLECVQEGIESRARRSSVLTTGLRRACPSAFGACFQEFAHQHRMHPQIAEFPRQVFYGGTRLKDANALEGRDEAVGWSFTSDAALPGAVLWVPVEGHEERGVNRDEVLAMQAFLDLFMAWASKHRRRDGRPWQVACLTFYLAQEGAIREMLQQKSDDRERQTRFRVRDIAELVCGTVDRFQGREADVALLSFRNPARVGFLDSPNRLNVALTRARHQLVLIGNRDFFASTRCRVPELQQLADPARIPSFVPPKPGRGR